MQNVDETGGSMNILEQLAEHARERVEYDKKIISEQGAIDLARSMGPANGEAFYKAIAKPDLGVICEIKKASPSKGLIDPVFDYMAIALEYELAGADAISCLTEPKWFLGSDAIFMDIRVAVKTPMLRKDFVVDPYQLYQARCMGADWRLSGSTWIFAKDSALQHLWRHTMRRRSARLSKPARV